MTNEFLGIPLVPFQPSWGLNAELYTRAADRIVRMDTSIAHAPYTRIFI